MPDLQPQTPIPVVPDGPAQGGPAGGAAAVNPAPSAGADPIASLYRMRTTAGVGAQEYVAINVPSIISLLLGLSGALALIEPIFLVLPLAGIVCGVAALRQVRQSNGTQSGRGLAWGGIVLGLIFTMGIVTRELMARSANRSDQQAVAALIDRFGREIVAGRYEAAYDLCNNRFKERVPFDTFVETWQVAQKMPDTPDMPGLGRIESIQWNRVPVDLVTDPASGTRVAQAMTLVKFQKRSEPGRQQMLFLKTGGQWMIDDIPQLFKRPEARGGGGGGGAGPGPSPR